MLIKIVPFDTVFFRDGRPFTMGDETWADGIFPPHPSVFYGALRTVYFSNHINEIKNANEKGDPTKNLRIKRMFYRIDNYEYYPVPLDLVHKKSERDDSEVINLKISDEEIISSADDNLKLLCSDEEVETLKDGVISRTNMDKYLDGRVDGITVKRLSDYIKKESKISIKRDKISRSSEKNKIYRLDFLRTINLEFCIEFDGIEIPDEGYLKIGGKNKGAYYMKVFQSDEIGSELPDKRFKVYLSTPAIFKKGWFPEWIDPITYEGNFKGINLKLITAAIGRCGLIGGFDMKAKKPKPMRKAVPAGSVYYFETDEGNMDNIKSKFNGLSISEYDTSKEGFGICYVGRWSNG